jgi:hypothetical protein
MLDAALTSGSNIKRTDTANRCAWQIQKTLHEHWNPGYPASAFALDDCGKLSAESPIL